MEPRLSTLTAQLEANQGARATVQYVRALAYAGNGPDALQLFASWMPSHAPRFEKAAVAAHTTTGDPALAFKPLNTDFLQLYLPSTLTGKLLSLGARRVPLNILTPIATDGTTATFVGERLPIPAAVVTMAQLSYMRLLKVAVILGFAREWLISTDPRVVGLLGHFLQRPIRAAEDLALLSTDARVEGQNPAGLLAGVASSGAGSPSSLDDDLPSLWANVRSGSPEKPVFVTSPRGALHLYGLRLEGVPVFPQAGPLGGSIAGVPLIVSPAATNRLILIDAACLGVCDSGITFDAARNATVQLDTAPSDVAGQTLTSGFQQDLGFVRVMRFVDWAVAHADGIGYVELPISA